MRIRGIVGMILVFQAAGFLSVHKIVDTRWLSASILLGLLGVILMRYRSREIRSSADFDETAASGNPIDDSPFYDTVGKLMQSHDHSELH